AFVRWLAGSWWKFCPNAPVAPDKTAASRKRERTKRICMSLSSSQNRYVDLRAAKILQAGLVVNRDTPNVAPSAGIGEGGREQWGEWRHSGFRLLFRGGAFLQRDRNCPQHITGRRRFARPDFKLPGGLLHKHFNSGDDGDPLGARDLQQVGLDRIVDHVEHDASLYLRLFERAVARVPHAHRSGVDDNVESNLAEVGAFDG